MRKLLSLMVGAALLAPGVAVARERATPEEQLAKLLDGRVAGEATDCINLGRGNSSQVIPGEAIVYREGNTLWVNRPRSGAEQLRGNEILVTRLQTSRLCSSDTVVLHDRGAGFMTGIVFLGEFVPYRKVQSARAD